MQRILTITASLFLATAPLHAGWKSESHALRAGWNAIYPFVDASDVPLGELLATTPQIEEVWRWNAAALDGVALENPSAPIVGADWSIWKRGFPADSTFDRLRPNYGYLVKVASGASPFNLAIKGRAAMPEVRWRNDGLNLVGFPTSEAAPVPTIGGYLSPAALVDAETRFYRYVGGALSASNPVELLNPVQQSLPRGEAFWINTGAFSDYYGPLRVEVALSPTGLAFGETGSLLQLVLRNRTDRTLTAVLAPAPSQTDRAGGSPSPVPLLERVFDPQTQRTSYPALDGPRHVTLPPGGTVAKVIAVDRAGLAGAPGTENASLLVVTDSEGQSRIDVPVTATVSDTAGLWVGEALINRIQNQLQQFERDGDGNYRYDEDGKRIPLAGTGNNELNATAQTFPVRLIIHVDASGKARLLSEVYAGPIATAVPGARPEFGITTDEGLLDLSAPAESVRLTTVHFPLDLDLGLTGAFASGGSLAGTVVLDHDAKENPFIHSFHPDHDNLDARFENPLPAGAESFRVDRALTLAFDAASPGGNPSWGAQILTGIYTEEITGIHKNNISVEGPFMLRRLANNDTLLTP